MQSIWNCCAALTGRTRIRRTSSNSLRFLLCLSLLRYVPLRLLLFWSSEGASLRKIRTTDDMLMAEFCSRANSLYFPTLHRRKCFENYSIIKTYVLYLQKQKLNFAFSLFSSEFQHLSTVAFCYTSRDKCKKVEEPYIFNARIRLFVFTFL